VVEGLQENECYASAGPPFRPNDTGAANERKDQSNANDVKQDSQESALNSIVDKQSSGKYTNSKVIFLIWHSTNVIVSYV
jgi:hypothetical protein